VQAERERGTLKGHTLGINRLAFAPQGKALVTASSDHTLKVWDWTRPREATILTRPAGAVMALALAPNGHTLAVSGVGREGGKVVEMWDLANGQGPVLWRGHERAIATMAFSPDSTTLATAGYDKTIILWDVATGKARVLTEKHEAPITSLAFSPGGRLLASAGPKSPVRLWDVAGAEELTTLLGGNGTARCLAFSPDGQTLAAGRSDGTVVLWDVTTGKVKNTLQGPSQAIIALAFSSDGDMLAGGSEDESVTLRDWAKEKTVSATLSGHDGRIGGLGFAPDSKTLMAVVRAKGALAGSVKLWDAGVHLERMSLRGEPYHVSVGAFGRDGRRLVVGTAEGAVMVWDGATDQEVKALERK
jgi:WD40 repeat protein